VTPVISATLLLTASKRLYMNKPLKLDYLWAAFCILGAVYFVFRSPGAP
jgi:uncharacterized protein (DUF486 family)